MIAFRSMLFSPGSRADMMDKAKRSGADSLIFDLEDAVAEGERVTARSAVTAALSTGASPPTFVRVNHPSTGQMEHDLDAVVSGRPFGVVLAKAEQCSDVVALDEALTARESHAGQQVGSIAILPLVESCRGLRTSYDMATVSSRIVGMAFSSGEDGDFMADLDGQWTRGGEAMLYPRSKLVCETRAAGLSWSVDGVFMNLDDDDALLEECRLARRLGFTAKMAIHPRQLAAIHEVFTPTADEVARSEDLLAAFEDAEEAGTGAFRHRGMMVDKANVRRARQVLARAVRPGPGRQPDTDGATGAPPQGSSS